jgi:hypothetical protein
MLVFKLQSPYCAVEQWNLFLLFLCTLEPVIQPPSIPFLASSDHYSTSTSVRATFLAYTQ